MNTAKYGTTTRNITHTALPRPDTSCRRNRSPITVISSQNHTTKIKIEKTSSRKLPKLKPPAKNISAFPPVRRHDRTLLRNQPAAVAYIDVSRAPSQPLLHAGLQRFATETSRLWAAHRRRGRPR